MAQKTETGVFVICPDSERPEHIPDGYNNLITSGIFDHAGIDRYDPVRIFLIDSGYWIPLLVMRENGVYLAAVMQRRIHPDHRVYLFHKIAQQFPDQAVFPLKLLFIGKALIIASAAFFPYRAQRAAVFSGL